MLYMSYTFYKITIYRSGISWSHLLGEIIGPNR